MQTHPHMILLLLLTCNFTTQSPLSSLLEYCSRTVTTLISKHVHQYAYLMAECIPTADQFLLCVVQHPQLTSIRRLIEELIEQGANWSDFTATLRLINRMKSKEWKSNIHTQWRNIVYSMENGIQHRVHIQNIHLRWNIEYGVDIQSAYHMKVISKLYFIQLLSTQ